MVAVSEFDGIMTVSGRADCPPTGRSNIALNVRLHEAEQAMRIWKQLLPRLRELHTVIQEPLKTFMSASEVSPSELADLFGPDLTIALRHGLRRVITHFGDQDFQHATLHGPTVEGIGTYPKINRSLRVTTHPIWVAGDAGGLFRGIVAALTSGHFAGQQALRYLTS